MHKPGINPHFNIQIKHRGERHRFPLETADKSIAAERARDRYLHLVAHGREATLTKFKPLTTKTQKIATTGAWLTAVKSSTGFRASTFTNYANSIRQIASELEEIGDQPAIGEDGEPKRDHRRRIIYLSKFNSQGGGHGLWLAKVDALPLSVLTATAVQKWKLAYIAKAGTSPDARRRAENTAASRLRSARSLFSAKALKFASDRPPRHETPRVCYRCEPHFQTIYAWLKTHGVTARKPLHELRKELGAILASKEGIVAAQSMLRHAQISMTAAYYIDKKKRITAGLGPLLTA